MAANKDASGTVYDFDQLPDPAKREPTPRGDHEEAVVPSEDSRLIRGNEQWCQECAAGNATPERKSGLSTQHKRGLDPIDCAQEVIRVAGDRSVSLQERFRRVDEAMDAVLLSFSTIETRKKPFLEELESETDEEYDEADEVSDAEMEEYIDWLARQAADIIEIGLDKIVRGLRVPDRVLPEEAIQQAQRHPELIAPRLIQVLEEAAATATLDEPYKDNAHFFAIFLLAEFEAEEAFPAIRKILSLPDGLPCDLFGDLVVDDLPKVLAPFTRDRPEILEEMIGDFSLDESVRGGAMMTVVSLVDTGWLSWEDGMRLLGRQIARDAQENNARTVDFLCDRALDLVPSSMADEIERACLADLPDRGRAVMEIIERAIADPAIRESYEPTYVDGILPIGDTLALLRAWACFTDEDYDDEEDELSLEDQLKRGLLYQAWADARELDSPPKPHFLEEHEEAAPVLQPFVHDIPPVGRNQPCPCGSGKKYKKCCGAHR
jgi:hypothetical protein